MQRPRHALCQQGRHMPGQPRTQVAAMHGGIHEVHAHCTRCGAALVHSPLTRRWRITGLMG